jgi:shikimate dehydrogenase
MITGSTKVYGVIGHPISHTLSPVLHNSLSSMQGLERDFVYVPLHVAPDALGRAISGAHALEIAGLNVTIPYKKAVMEFLWEIEPTAKAIGSVNTLRWTKEGYAGRNTDHSGLYRALIRENITVRDKIVVVFGAGGGGCAAAYMAASNGAAEIFIVNRTREPALALADGLTASYKRVRVQVLGLRGLDRIQWADLAVQTTSLGFGAECQASPVEDPAFFKRVACAVDIIYTPWETVFLSQARAAGCVVMNGFLMLVYQGIEAYEWWNDIEVTDGQADELLSRLTPCARCIDG